MQVQRTFFPRFARRAVIVASAIGQLQAERLEKENERAEARLFNDPDKALAFIRF